MKKGIKIAFFGTPDFAAFALRTLVERGYEVVCVVTMPDKPAGRGHKLQPSAVKSTALSLGLPILQPQNLKEREFLKALEGYGAETFVVVAFRMLPKEVWGMPPRGTFNLHASLLPRYRGAAPIQHAILRGEVETGVTTFMLDEKIDTGMIMLQAKTPITPDETGGSLHDKLMILGADLIAETIDLLALPTPPPLIPQETLASPADREAPKIFKEDRRLSFASSSATELERRVRAMSPYPAAFAVMRREGSEPIEIKIFAAKAYPSCPNLKAGEGVVTKEKRWRVQCQEGSLEILELQLPSKKRVRVEEFLNGYTLTREERFE